MAPFVVIGYVEPIPAAIDLPEVGKYVFICNALELLAVLTFDNITSYNGFWGGSTLHLQYT